MVRIAAHGWEQFVSKLMQEGVGRAWGRWASKEALEVSFTAVFWKSKVHVFSKKSL